MCLLAMSISGFLLTASAYNISKAVIHNQNITEIFPRYQFPDNKVSGFLYLKIGLQVLGGKKPYQPIIDNKTSLGPRPSKQPHVFRRFYKEQKAK